MRLSASLIATLLVGCGPLVHAQLAPVEVCREMQRMDIPAAPFVVDGTWTGDERWILPPELRQPLEGIDPKVELMQIELRTEGVENVGFIREARMRTRVEPATAPVEIAASQTDDPTALLFVPERPVDVTPALESGALQMLAEISARLPQHPWAVVVNACYRAGGTYEWAP